jgi:Na+/melibiose symporter-like transporter
LGATGYVANQPQTELAQSGIIVNVLIIPMALYLTALLVFGFGYNINSKKLAEINEELNKRREVKYSDA